MKIFSSVLVITIFIFLSSVVNAQKKEDVIYLSDGSVIRGNIISDSTERNVRILNKSGDIWSFSKEKVDSIKQEKAFVYKAFVFNQKGSEFNINGALMVRSGRSAIDKAAIPGLNIGYSYRLRPFLSLGMEAGIEFYDRMIVPVSAFLRIRSSGNVVSPFLHIRTGYSLPAEKRPDDWDYSYTGSGGIHASAGIGIERILNENAAFTFSFLYNYQELHYHLDPLHQWVQERDRTQRYNRLRISLGYVFK